MTPVSTARVPEGRGASVEAEFTIKAITIIVASIAGSAFLFGFGNCWALGIRLGVPGWIAPLVGPAVDLSVVGLLLARRFLALHGASPVALAPIKRMLIDFHPVVAATKTRSTNLIGEISWTLAAQFS
jgi:hypothetical protein